MKVLIQKNLLVPACLILLAIVNPPVFAAGSCSPFLGLATINEFFKDKTNQANDADDYVEVKVLDSSITAAEFSQWSIRICEDNDPGNNNDGDGCSAKISLSDFTETTPPWLILKDGDVGKYINFKTGFDAILLDANDDVIDYLSVDGHTQLEEPGCTGASLPYDYQASSPGASDKYIFRTPDGTGAWDSATAASTDPTEDASNDDDPSNPIPNLIFSEPTINQGTTTASVTLTLDFASTDIISINFYTFDGTLFAGTDYTAVNTTGDILAGGTSLTFDVPVSPASSVGVFNFFVIIEATSVGRASIADHVGQITVVGAPAVDHFNINVGGGAANTCNPFNFSVTAADSGNNPITNYSGTILLTTTEVASANPLHGNFNTVTATNSISPNPDNDDNGSASYTFDILDNGLVTLSLTNEHAETLVISVTDSTVPVTSTSASVTFSDNAFTIIDNDVLVAGDNVPVAGRDHSYQIQMIRKDSLVGCGVATGYTGLKPLKMWRTKNVLDPSPNDPVFAGIVLPSSDQGVNGSVTFNSGVANVTLVTNDIGKFSIELEDISNTFADITIAGTSDEQTVRPFGLAVTNIEVGAGATLVSNPGSTAFDDPVFTTAGSNFRATVAGVLWSAADDTEAGGGDGLLDTGVYYDNAIAPSYAWSTTLLALTTGGGFTPATGVVGSLNNGNVLATDFSAGAYTKNDLQYTEVGSFTLQSSATGFLSEPTANIVGDNIIVGRFIPAFFHITPQNGEFANACVPAVGTQFTYIGEPFFYGATHPSFTVRAMNALATPTVTQNYTGVFAKLDDSSVSLTSPTADGTQDGSDGSAPMAITYTHASPYNITDNGDGTLNFQFANDEFVYDRDANSEISEFSSDIDLTITDVTDSEGVTTTAGSTLTPDPVLLRFGRIKMSNVHGSELIDLQMPMIVEYFNAGAYTINGDDTCTAVITGDLSITDSLSTVGASSVSVTNTPILLGDLGVTLTAPGAGIEGNIIVKPSLTGVADWLQYEWDTSIGVGPFDDDPWGMATFGIYSGNDVNIYQIQTFQ